MHNPTGSGAPPHPLRFANTNTPTTTTTTTTMTMPLSTPASTPTPRLQRWRAGLRVLVAVSAVLGLGVWCVGLPVQAASLATSSASLALDSLSTSVGVFSGSVSGVSQSSSGGGKVAQGQYRIEQTRRLDTSPARMAVDLKPDEDSQLAGAQPWQLRVPVEVVASAGLEPGQMVVVRDRGYGFALWQPGAAQPFYLVVEDLWAQALQVRPLGAETRSAERP